MLDKLWDYSAYIAVIIIAIIILVWYTTSYNDADIHIDKGLYGQWKAEDGFCKKMEITNLSLFIGKSGNPRKCLLICNSKNITLWLTFVKETVKDDTVEYVVNIKYPVGEEQIFKKKTTLVFNKDDGVILLKKGSKIQAELFKDNVISTYARRNEGNPIGEVDAIEYEENFTFDPSNVYANEAQTQHQDYVQSGGMNMMDASDDSLWNNPQDLLKSEKFAPEGSSQITEALDNDDITGGLNKYNEVKSKRHNDVNNSKTNGGNRSDQDLSGLISDFNRNDAQELNDILDGADESDDDLIM